MQRYWLCSNSSRRLKLSLTQVLRAANNAWLCCGDRSRPAAADEAVEITGTAKTAAKTMKAVEVRMDQTFRLLSIWRHPSIRI